MQRAIITTAVLLFVLAATVRADTKVGEGFDSDSVMHWEAWITDPVAVGDGSEDLVAFTLRIVSLNVTNDRYDPAGFDGTQFDYTGLTQGAWNTKGLHQHYGGVFTPGPRFTADTGVASYPTAIDTHFL